jgi:hypothetical protein
MAFVQRQILRDETYAGPEHRTQQRLLLAMPVIVQGVDERMSPVGAPQAMVIRDFSRQGTGLVHELPFEHRRIVMRFSYPEEGTLLAAEVRWTKPLGPFYHLLRDVARLKVSCI